jgi:hypothetical protein
VALKGPAAYLEARGTGVSVQRSAVKRMPD